jgi:hypothetical protein
MQGGTPVEFSERAEVHCGAGSKTIANAPVQEAERDRGGVRHGRCLLEIAM